MAWNCQLIQNVTCCFTVFECQFSVYCVYACLHYEFVALPNVSAVRKRGQGDALNGNILWLSCENCLQHFYLAMSGMCQRTLWKVIQGLKDSRTICKSHWQLMQVFKQTINTDYGKISNVLDSSQRVCRIHCNAVMQKQLGLFYSIWSCGFACYFLRREIYSNNEMMKSLRFSHKAVIWL